MQNMIFVTWQYVLFTWHYLPITFVVFVSTVRFLDACQKVYWWYKHPETFPIYCALRWVWQRMCSLWRQMRSLWSHFFKDALK